MVTPDETEWPSCGHSTDSPALEPESARRRHPSLCISVETPLDDPDGCHVGLGPSSHPVEALWDLSLPHTEELCLPVSLSPSSLFLTSGFDNWSGFWPSKCLLQGLCPVLEPEGGGGGRLDSQHQRRERILSGAAESQLHHRQPCGGLRTPLLRPHPTLGHINFCTVAISWNILDIISFHTQVGFCPDLVPNTSCKYTSSIQIYWNLSLRTPTAVL